MRARTRPTRICAAGQRSSSRSSSCCGPRSPSRRGTCGCSRTGSPSRRRASPRSPTATSAWPTPCARPATRWSASRRRSTGSPSRRAATACSSRPSRTARVDIFTGGRKLRVAVSPEVEIADLRHGQEVMLNEAMNVVAARGFERAGEVVMLKEILDGGDRALVVGHTDEERVVYLADLLREAPAARRRLAAARDAARPTPTSGCPRARSRSSSSKRFPTSTTPTSAGSPARSRRSATPSSCRSCTPTCSASTSCARRRASCSTARPAAARR